MSLDSVSNTNKIFTFDPANTLVGGNTYKIIVTTGVKDGSGIPMAVINETVSGNNGFTVPAK